MLIEHSLFQLNWRPLTEQSSHGHNWSGFEFLIQRKEILFCGASCENALLLTSLLYRMHPPITYNLCLRSRTAYLCFHLGLYTIQKFVLLCIELPISFLIGRKRTLNFRNQRPWRYLAADYTIIMFKDTGQGQSCHAWPRCMQELLLLLCFQLRMVCVACISMTSQCNRWLKFCGLSIIHWLFMIVSI